MTIVLPRDALWLPPSGKQILRDYLTGRKADWDRLQEWIRDQIAVATIGNPTQIGTNTAQTSGQTTLAASGCVIPSSNLAVAALINSNGATAPGDASGVSDGTTAFQKDLSNGGQSNVGNVQFWSLYYSGGATKTITATFPSSNMTYLYVFSISGAASSSYVDVTGTSNSSSSTSMLQLTTTPNSGLVAQADSVGIGMFGQGTTDTAPSVWPGVGLSSLVNTVNTTRHLRISIEYLTPLTAGVVFTASGTAGALNNIGRTAIVYKGGAAATTTTASVLQLLGVG